ncbi:MAG: hypothetical protein AW07_03016 [Candidatus Accumulibacter sp. SK-11]|nr:MAG: hypothetical protein AW07_03016 [Candidatus Accumulibacter sp. SK-11]
MRATASTEGAPEVRCCSTCVLQRLTRSSSNRPASCSVRIASKVLASGMLAEGKGALATSLLSRKPSAGSPKAIGQPKKACQGSGLAGLARRRWTRAGRICWPALTRHMAIRIDSAKSVSSGPMAASPRPWSKPRRMPSSSSAQR